MKQPIHRNQEFHRIQRLRPYVFAEANAMKAAALRAKDTAIEFNSPSKTYPMPGWRIEFATGNARLIKALACVKSCLDYSAFTPIQVAATAVLNGPLDCVEQTRALYQRQRDVLLERFGTAARVIPPPRAMMFAWAPAPVRFSNIGSLEFSKLLLKEPGVAVPPDVGFDEYGEGHVRIALDKNRYRIRQAERTVKRFLWTSPDIHRGEGIQAAAAQ